MIAERKAKPPSKGRCRRQANVIIPRSHLTRSNAIRLHLGIPTLGTLPVVDEAFCASFKSLNGKRGVEKKERMEWRRFLACH